MKKDNTYTETEIDQWCNIFDQDIVIEIWENQMIFEELEFEEFLKNVSDRT